MYGALFFVFTTRNDVQMEKIAVSELNDFLGNGYNKTLKLNGPVVSKKTKRFVEYFWFRELERGDSAKIFIQVYKAPFSPTRFNSWWRNYLLYMSPSITMNNQWNYLILKTSSQGLRNYEYLFSTRYSGINFEKNVILSQDSIKYQKYKIMITDNKLLYLLNHGYFRVLNKKNTESLIMFYEPIANLYLNKKNAKNDTVFVMMAKIFFNKGDNDISVLPYYGQ